MKSTRDLDPARCSYGPGTAAVREMLVEWAAIDWFEAPRTGAERTACALFEEHHQKGRAQAPERFAPRIEVWPIRGGWGDFTGLCTRVRKAESWDWRYSVLKRLSHAHTEARGRSFRDLAPDLHDPARSVGSDPGGLFFRIDDVVIWNNPGPSLDLRSVLLPSDADSAGFYLCYAGMDLTHALEWQLVERSDRVDENPFLPLVRCYAAGFYPFSLGPGSVVLFAFEEATPR